MIRKVVESAIANAENNQGADVDALKVKSIMVDEGPTLKRFMARAKGRGTRILKRTSHITVVVGEKAEIIDGSQSSSDRYPPWHLQGLELQVVRRQEAFAEYLVADLLVREMLRKKLAQAGISKILIERPANNARVTIHTARPGVVIGKRGEDIEKLRKEVSDLMGVPAHINVTEVRKPELDAQLVSESIAQQLERRIMFRRAMKRAVGNAIRLGALGIKVNVAGRLNGAEIARSEWYREGRVPLHTLRADIDYGFAEAKTTYGIIGIKVWVYKGEIFDFSQVGQEKQDDSPRSDRGDRSDRPRPSAPRT